MKKYLSGIFAFALAAGMSAFTIPSKVANSDYYFVFNNCMGYNKDQVQDPRNWVLSELPLVCPSSNVKACEIGVPASSVDMWSNQILLKSDLIIYVDDPVVSGQYRVETSADVSEVYNRQY